MANFYITINDDGQKQEVEASDVSAGVADAGKVVALNPDGLIDSSMVTATELQSQTVNVSGTFALDMSRYDLWELTLLGDTLLACRR